MAKDKCPPTSRPAPSEVTAAFRDNCSLNREVMLHGSDKPLPNVDCSKLEAPKDTTLEAQQERGKQLKYARDQLKMIDPRRAY